MWAALLLVIALSTCCALPLLLVAGGVVTFLASMKALGTVSAGLLLGVVGVVAVGYGLSRVRRRRHAAGAVRSCGNAIFRGGP